MSGGFNRWRHPQRHGPALMQPTTKGGFGFAKIVIDVRGGWGGVGVGGLGLGG